MASTDAKPVPQKNVAYRHYFAIRDNAGALVTTWAGQDSELSGDGGNYADATNEATEVQTSGTGYIDLTSGEMNYDHVALKVSVTNTDALTYVVDLFPEQAGDIRVNSAQIGGTSQTGRDLGASVLLSSGTGTGQLSISSGVVKSNLSQILGTALTETSGYIAAAFKKLFNVATPLMVASTAIPTDVATETKQDTAQTDLDTITGTDGVTLATSQANYAPSKAGDEMGITTAGITAIWAKVVDTGFSALATLKRMLARLDGSNDAPVDDGTTITWVYKNKADGTETTHVVTKATGKRVVS